MRTAPRTKPRSRSVMKASSAADCAELQQIPNIGPAMVRDFELLGISRPAQLAGQDPLALYKRLCQLTSQRHDPCVLDTFMAAVDFMNGAESKAWFAYTAERKLRYPDV